MSSPIRPLPPVRRTALALGLSALYAGAAAEPLPAFIPTVVVTAAGFEQNVRQAPASITVLTREALAQERFGNLTQALESVEGVDVGAASDKTGGMNISVRGMPSDYTLILIDGRRQNSAGNVAPNGFGGTQTSFMPPLGAIERIEIIRGPMSTLYGSDAMGGVVNIITRKVGKKWTAALTADYTVQEEASFGDQRSAKFHLSGPVRADLLGLALRGSVSRRNAADIRYTTQAGTEAKPVMGANPVASELRNLGARLAFTPHRDHTVVLDADASRQTYDNARGQLGTLGLKGGYGPEQEYRRDQLSASWRARMGVGTLDTALMRNRTETLGRTIPPGTPGAVAGSARTLAAQSPVLDAKLLLPLGAHLATVGAQWWDASMRDGVAPNRFAFTQKALFAEDEWRLHDSFSLTLGARYDRHSVFGGELSPRVYGVWNAGPNWTVKGGVSKGYKTPRVEQLTPGINGFGGQGTIPLVGSPGLQPETSVSTELGFFFDNHAGTTANASLFNNAFRDKITSGTGLLNCSYAPAPQRPGCVSFGHWPNVDAFGQSINVDEAVTHGLELGARFPLGQALSATANYTYTDSEQKSGSNAGKPLTDTPRHAVNARLQWSVSPTWKHWLRTEYRSERFRDPGTSAESRAAKAALGDYRGYTMLHLGSSYKLSRKVSINAALYNLLNKNFVDYQAYRASTTAAFAYANRFVNSLEGRRLWLSLNVEV